MNLKETLALALGSLQNNKLRTFLTMLGIVIGVASVITMVSVIDGAKTLVSREIESLGSNLILVRIAPQKYASARLNRTQSQPFTLSEAMAIKEKAPDALRVAPMVTFNGRAKYGTGYVFVPVDGVTLDFFDMRNFSLGQGAFFAPESIVDMDKVAILGKTVAEDLFGSDDPIGATIKINAALFHVIGVMAEKGQALGVDNDNRIFVPITAAQRLTGSLAINTLYVQARNAEGVAPLSDEVTNILMRKYNNPDSFSVKSQEEILGMVSRVTFIFSVMLGGIAAVSLLVGGIGILNIMLVSVVERTREIGLRKAVGARRGDILRQFLVEAVTLCLLGGGMGIILGWIGAFFLSHLAGWPPSISYFAVVIGFCFSSGVGIFFGLYPAQKAADLDPIEALRYE
ncbi:MAG: ABC transporter permease [Firmicutes bacterium]|nr:ABC transporter permease [Bacillota bacterium]MCL5039489.1 ABC transporter permease [Bacillota bacterium]